VGVAVAVGVGGMGVGVAVAVGVACPNAISGKVNRIKIAKIALDMAKAERLMSIILLALSCTGPVSLSMPPPIFVIKNKDATGSNAQSGQTTHHANQAVLYRYHHPWALKAVLPK
jgi:hypothetical protein